MAGWLKTSGLLLLSASALVACGISHDVGADAMHRVTGVIYISPVGAGPQLIGDSSRAPLANVEVRLHDQAGTKVAVVVSDADGRFTLMAPAGRYELRAGMGKLPRCPAVAVVLPLQSDASVEIECDSGMR